MSQDLSPSWRDYFGTRRKLKTPTGEYVYYSLAELEKQGFSGISNLPYSIKVLLEAALRQEDGFVIEEGHVRLLASYNPLAVGEEEIPFKPARVLMQDFTGVPGVVDLAAMRDAIKSLGLNPAKINPVLPVDLVIDHSVQVDYAGTADALKKNTELEFKRNYERYEFLRWGSRAFRNFSVVPPATGIVHQVNLEYLAKVVQRRQHGGEVVVFPDSLVGTDSHTTMVNGLGVLGWGVGGIEAEAVMLEQPIYMLIPEVVGFRLKGELPPGATATDLVLTVTQMLRKFGVVGKFVEFFGEGVKKLSLADRATIANMAPEYGATVGFFAVDEETLNYLKLTGRPKELIDLVERYTKEQGLFMADNYEPRYSSLVELDMSSVVPSLAGPRRPQDRLDLKESKKAFRQALQESFKEDINRSVSLRLNGKETTLRHGSVVIAAITSCTNTSNPSVLIAAGLVAKKAVEKGLTKPAHVKASLAPGSKVVKRYLEEAHLQKYLDELGFQVVGYGCTTCIGNSGPLPMEIEEAVGRENLIVTAVLSGNRNFEGRIHPVVKANYLASPPLVVAYALAGTMDIDWESEPIGVGSEGPVYLKDIWPSQNEVKELMEKFVRPELFQKEYADVFSGNHDWNNIRIEEKETYTWSEKSTYIRRPPYFEGFSLTPPGINKIENMYVLAILGDSVTTDHISPAGSIKKDSPAGRWLIEQGVEPKDFNTYGARRGNHEVMMRGTFANIRIRNLMLANVEGGYTRFIPTGEVLTIYDAAMKYKAMNAPLVVIAGKEYGTGSSRDWAAKGTALLGVKVVLAESFERIHRSNLIGMGVLPLQFEEGQNAQSLGLTGEERLTLLNYGEDVKPRQKIEIEAKKPSGESIRFYAICRIDTPVEVEYMRHGGILPYVLRKLAAS
ncbi:MAG: aconitate hydratase AcnA [Leptospiraceae bacterium]|nr:aconitate hydratase AcnA [Leptospiraceae bacterium]MDW8307027.1 aconitate hydratase AcnA [Leptospiraceae bacterium]